MVFHLTHSDISIPKMHPIYGNDVYSRVMHTGCKKKVKNESLPLKPSRKVRIQPVEMPPGPEPTHKPHEKPGPYQ
jgi:hypothetical protein